jgi:hypothetical protein
MDALPIRPQGPHNAPHRVAHPARRTSAAGTARASHTSHTSHTSHAPHTAHAAAAPASPGDMAALEEQAAFDAVASARAEQQREMNVLRDIAMMQVKRDDQALNGWVKLI